MLIAAAALGVVLATLIAGASQALAAPKTIDGFIGGAFGGAGGQFAGPNDVEVYTAGDSDPTNDKIFVAESNRVQRLDVHGNFELAWGGDVVSAGEPGDTGTGAEICTEATSCRVASPGTGSGQFSEAHGIAVSQTSARVYVLDRDNLRVQEFSLDGAFVRAWGWNVAPDDAPGDTPSDEFEICTSECQRGTPGSGDGQFGETFANGVGIAVDPVNGDVFTADPANARVQQFAADGTFVATFGASGTGLGEFGEGEPLRLAVDSSHIVYISDSNASNRIQRYDADSDTFLAPIACCSPDTPGVPLVDGITVGLEIDPDTDAGGGDEEHLLAARDPFFADTVVQELDIPTPATDPVTTVVDTHVYEVDPSAPNIESDRDVRGIAINPGNGIIYLATPSLFTPPNGNGTFTGCADPDRCVGLIALSVESGPVNGTVVGSTDTGATTLSVMATVNAGGGVASYRLEVSTDGANWNDVGAGGYVSGAEDVPVTGHLTGLQPNTLYRVRLVVRKQDSYTTSVSAVSNELVIPTDAAPPDAETLGSTARTDRSVRLQARIDPNGSATTYRFEYGLVGGSFDRRVPIPDGSAGAGNNPDLVVADIDGLQPQTTYQYRVVASNFAGTDVGEIVTFTTDATELARPPAGRGYELVSPADKVGGTGVGEWYTGPAISAQVGYGAHVGERFAVLGYLGSVLVDGPYTYSTDWALAERTPSGWVNRPGISRRAHGSQAKADISMTAAADDLSLSTWSSAHMLRLFPEMETWQGAELVTFARDWTSGMWELFGPTDQAQGSTTDSRPLVAANGSAVVVASRTLRGLAGPGDPTNVAFPDLEGGANIWRDDVSDGMRDTFPGDNGVRTLVNVCTDGTVLPARIEVGDAFKQGAVDCPGPLSGRDSRLISPRGASLEALPGDQVDTEGAVSADGSRVFFTSPDPQMAASVCDGTGLESSCPAQMFVWQRNADGTVMTRWISRTEVTDENGAAADQDASLMAPTFFEGASADGDKVFFRTNAPLTADDPNGAASAPPGGVTTGEPDPQSWDLYMYDLPNGPNTDPADGDLVRISAGPSGDADCNVPAGTLRFVSDEGGRAYFTCAAPVPGVPLPNNGTITDPGGTGATTSASNLYLHDADSSSALRWRFVGRLPVTSTLGECATRDVGRGAACINGTADGSLLTFFTDGRLTGDDPDDVSGDIYGYDAISDELSRLSAPQGGVGGAYECRGAPCYGDDGFRTGSPVYPLERLGVALRPDGDRLAFFESRSRLVPEDTDDAYDVYQWRDGDLSLISTGKSGTDGAFFAGNDKSGLNVYLTTRDRLTWQDKDAVLDVYTARIGGGIPEPPPHPSCELSTDGCQRPGAGPPQSRIVSKAPGRGNAQRGDEPKIAAISRRARRRAARTGVLSVRVRVPRAGSLVVTARARVAGKVRRVASARKRVAKAGMVTVKLRLNRAARRRLGRGDPLALRISARSGGLTADVTSLRLKRSGR